MKKLITILAIMIVLVGTVFASTDVGNASLIVKATISEILPTFALTTSDSDVSSITQAQYANPTAQNNGVTAAISAQTGYATITNSTPLVTAEGSVTVTFSVKQISDSSTTRSFYLSAQATNLVRVKDPTTNGAVNGGTGTISVTSNFSGENAFDANDMFPVDGGTAGVVVPTINAGAQAAVANYSTNHVKGTANATTSTTLDLTYDGVKINAYSSNIEVGTFDVKWNANVNARPGDYEACVKLTITSN